MRMALALAHNAYEAGEFPVGCVIVDKGEVVADGTRSFTDHATSEIEHSELVALRKLLETKREINRERLTVYSTMEPCLMCYSTLILNGIRSIVYGFEDAMGGGTNLKLDALAPLYREMRVEIVPHVLREESLLLFQKFFANPKNTYWKDSLLSRYTLSQEVTQRKDGK